MYNTYFVFFPKFNSFRQLSESHNRVSSRVIILSTQLLYLHAKRVNIYLETCRIPRKLGPRRLAVSVVGRCSKLMLGGYTRPDQGYHRRLSALDSAETWFAVIFACPQVRRFERI